MPYFLVDAVTGHGEPSTSADPKWATDLPTFFLALLTIVEYTDWDVPWRNRALDSFTTPSQSPDFRIPGSPRISPAFLGYPIPGYIMLSEVPQATHSKKPPMEYGSEPSGFRTYSIGGLWMHTRIHRICCAIMLRSQQQLRYAMPLASITVRGRRTMQCLRDAIRSCPSTGPQPRSA